MARWKSNADVAMKTDLKNMNLREKKLNIGKNVMQPKGCSTIKDLSWDSTFQNWDFVINLTIKQWHWKWISHAKIGILWGFALNFVQANF